MEPLAPYAGRNGPMPRATLFEKQLRMFAMGAHNGSLDENLQNVPKRYPKALQLAAESERVMVVGMYAVHKGMLYGGPKGQWGALVRFGIKSGEDIPASERVLFGRLGLAAEKKRDGSWMVEAVTTGGFVDSWGVEKGMKIAQVGEDFTFATIAMATPFSLPMTPQRLNVLASTSQNPLRGGVAFLVTQFPKNRQTSGKVSVLCASLNFSSEAAVLEYCAQIRKSLEEGPNVSDDKRLEVEARKELFADGLAERLKFDVEEDFRPGYPGVLVMKCIAIGSRAARYGLQNRDVLLSLNGHHLIFVSRLGFLMTVANSLDKCASGAKSLGMLRFLVAREYRPTTIGSVFRELDSKISSPEFLYMSRNAKKAKVKRDKEERAKGQLKATWTKEHEGAECKEALGRSGAWPAGTAKWERMMKVRPAYSLRCLGGRGPEVGGEFQQNGGVEKRGPAGPSGYSPGQPVPPGIFVRETLQIGDMLVPAGAQLVSVGGISCRDMVYKEALALAMSTRTGDELLFDF
ncbi:unnamed protein product [Scytosiphon promiscuus]